jgi:mono/diheme cytochrome c family protein
MKHTVGLLIVLSTIMGVRAVHGLKTVPQAALTRTGSARAIASTSELPEGFYTVEQAARGRLLFNQWCGACHTMTGTTTQLTTGRGI